MPSNTRIRGCLPLALLALLAVPAFADDRPASENTAALYEQSVAKGISYLITNGQAPDGSFSSQTGTGVTSLATTALLRHGVPVDSEAVSKALKFIEKHIQPDGGIYQPGSNHRNYETCLAILCLSEANQDGRYDETIARADGFIKGIQWDAEEGKDVSDPAYGGAGYGSHKRPDLSNTSFLIDALKAAGNDENSEAIQRALIFVSRSQNLETEHNTTPFAAKNPDGGFYYTPAAGGTSQAGETPQGGLRSYGSMTYSGLKSMLYAGVSEDDPRVKAAVNWLRKHYDLEENPGMGAAGLYYYYHVFAKALDALGQDTFVGEDGKHDWRAELIAELASRQQKNGAWINEQNDRWLEGDANLVTSYALLALRYCRPEK
ncbi:MAG: terpene cyclase/mutase family protein [Planctomycetes bacterium]|nr:terpene cyclase/mutase family protein [Planctomycetota bacterium]